VISCLVLLVAAPAGAQPPVSMFVDTPPPHSTVLVPFLVAGWALNPQSPSGPDVDVVRVSATPVTGRQRCSLVLPRWA
jgi:hypothetical protein